MMFGESENNTDKTVHFNADMELITDTQEQTENEQAFGTTKPTVKTTNYDIFRLYDDEEPQSFTLTMMPPIVDIGNDDYDRDYFGDEEITMEFNID